MARGPKTSGADQCFGFENDLSRTSKLVSLCVCVWWWCNTFLTWHETKKRRKKRKPQLFHQVCLLKLKQQQKTLVKHVSFTLFTDTKLHGTSLVHTAHVLTREKKEQEHNFCFVCQIISNVYYGQNNWNLKLKLNETKYLDKI